MSLLGSMGSLSLAAKGKSPTAGCNLIFPVSRPLWSVAVLPQFVLRGPAAAFFLLRPSVSAAPPLSAVAIVWPHCLPDAVRIDLSDFYRRHGRSDSPEAIVHVALGSENPPRRLQIEPETFLSQFVYLV